MFGVRPSIILARPSAAPHIARRSWRCAAFWRSTPAFWISPSAAPSAIVARTVVPGHRSGVAPGARLPAPPEPSRTAPLAAGPALPPAPPDGGTTGPTIGAVGVPVPLADGPAEPHAARTVARTAVNASAIRALAGPR